MSSNSQTQAHPTEVFFRSVNGECLILEEKEGISDNIINLALRSKKHFNLINLYLVLLCATFLTWILSKILILFIISVYILIWQCKLFITSVKQGKFLFLQ